MIYFRPLQHWWIWEILFLLLLDNHKMFYVSKEGLTLTTVNERFSDHHLNRVFIQKLMKRMKLTCPLRMEANFNFCPSNCNLCLFFVTVSRRSEIVIQAFHRLFWKRDKSIAKNIRILSLCTSWATQALQKSNI